MCLYPKLIKNKKYLPNKKNGGKPPVMKDERTMYVPVGCGKCMECMKQKANSWRTRLNEEARHTNNGRFITFTIRNNEFNKLHKEVDMPFGYESMNKVATLAVRRFLERWRKKYKKSVRHWITTEIGHRGTERLHLHGILYTDVDRKTISEIWGYGFCNIRNVCSEKSISYIVKYMNKVDPMHKDYRPVVLCSKGIGSGYLERKDSKDNQYKGEDTKEYYRTRSGRKAALPIYYRNKLYNEDEREQLWLMKLDKQERWVGGERVDISQSEEQYEKLRAYWRRKNKAYGYGDDRKTWDEILYKKRRKALKRKKFKDLYTELIPNLKYLYNLGFSKKIRTFDAVKQEVFFDRFTYKTKHCQENVSRGTMI